MIGNMVVPAIMVIAGVLLLAMGNAIVKEVGKALLWAGLFALAFYFSGHRISF